ncbi:MAG: InlB B-repeat-containing protein, partial [Clostridia bacterium]|nr:InlB B-repeat-containing protein [Clostridia bacterium]
MKRMSVKLLSVLLAVAMLVSAFSAVSMSASAITVVPTKLVRQNLEKWKNYTYGDSQGTLYRTGCGMFAIVNAVGYLTGNEMSVTEVASWGHAICGYNPGNSHSGTYRMTIYPRLEAKYGKRYGFTVDCGSSNEGYWAGSSSSTLKNHLKKGGVAIGHVPGHFIAIVGYDSSTNYFHVYDSYPTSARGTGNGDAWVTQSHLATGKLKLDWFCLLSSTGTVINNQQVNQGYTVSFDSRGGSAVSPQTVKEGAYATNPGAPSRDGFEFLGWYDEDGYLFEFATTGIWANRSLHAAWKAIEWPQTTEYMPQQHNTVVEEYTSGGESYVWPYYNPQTGALTMYKGGADYGWPSINTTYQTSVDLSKYAYLNVSVVASAQFNAEILFRDANMQPHAVRLSQIINGNDNDFAPGTYTLRANLGNFLYGQTDYAMPENGVVNIESIRYYVVGNTDEFVSLNNVCFTGEQDYHNLMNPNTLSQEATAGASGNYTYENGKLRVEGTGGYTVSFTPNETVSIANLPYWVVAMEAGTNFDLSMIVTTTEGDRRISLVEDYYNLFGFESYPENGLLGGIYARSLNLLQLFNWHGVLPADGNSTIKKISVELLGEGGVTLSANQISNAPVEYYFTDSENKSDSWAGGIRVDNDAYVLNEDTDVLLTNNAGLTVAQTKAQMANGSYVRFFDGDNEVSDATVVKTGMIVKVMNGDVLIAQYTLAITGDLDGNGTINTADVRAMLIKRVNSGDRTVSQEAAADADGDGTV